MGASRDDGRNQLELILADRREETQPEPGHPEQNADINNDQTAEEEENDFTPQGRSDDHDMTGMGAATPHSEAETQPLHQGSRWLV